MNAKASEAVLFAGRTARPLPAAIAVSLALADCGSTEAIILRGTEALSALMGLRALIYPYARHRTGPGATSASDKDYLGRLHLRPNSQRPKRENAALADHHKTAIRTG